MRAAFLSVWAVILCIAFIQAANGLQTDLIGVRADMAAFLPQTIGWLMAAYYVGYSAAPLAGRAVIGRIGHVRTVIACAFIAGAIIVAHAFVVTPLAWTGFRFVSGFALAMVYVALESWINDKSSNALRGRVFSFYIAIQMVAMTLSQVLLTEGDPRNAGPFILCGVLFALAAIPIAMASRNAPASGPPAPVGLLKLFHMSPLGAITTVLSGVSWAIVFTFGPVFARHSGLPLSGIAWFMGLAMAAGAVSQFPLGWLSDVIGRRLTIGLIFGVGIAVSLFGLWTTGRGPEATLIASALAGGSVFPLYAISVAHVNDVAAPQTRVAVAAGLVLLFGLGSIFGPLLCGWAMTAMGPQGYYASLAAIMAAGALVAARFR